MIELTISAPLRMRLPPRLRSLSCMRTPPRRSVVFRARVAQAAALRANAHRSRACAHSLYVGILAWRHGRRAARIGQLYLVSSLFCGDAPARSWSVRRQCLPLHARQQHRGRTLLCRGMGMYPACSPGGNGLPGLGLCLPSVCGRGSVCKGSLIPSLPIAEWRGE